MQTKTFNHAEIPTLGFGTYRVLGADAKRMVSEVLNMGFRHIDTAQIYDNEEAVGDGVKASNVSRENIFLTTKIWVDNYSSGTFATSLENSLIKLKTDYVDLLLLHWPNSSVSLEEQIAHLNAAQKAGKVRHIGVSNFNISMMKEAVNLSDTPIVTNQIEYHPFLNQTKVREAASNLGMSITAYFGMADGKIFETSLLQDIAAKHHRSIAQIGLRWLIQQDGVIALSKTLNETRAAENLAVFDFSLSTEEMNSIHDLALKNGRIANPKNLAPEWDISP